jgi:hypothetical protein
VTADGDPVLQRPHHVVRVSTLIIHLAILASLWNSLHSHSFSSPTRTPFTRIAAT